MLATALAVASPATAGGRPRPWAAHVPWPSPCQPIRSRSKCRERGADADPRRQSERLRRHGHDHQPDAHVRRRRKGDGRRRPGPALGRRRVGSRGARCASPPQSYRNVAAVRFTSRTAQPDLYFVGFLVTPVAAEGGSIKVINQIGSFLTVDVPGPAAPSRSPGTCTCRASCSARRRAATCAYEPRPRVGETVGRERHDVVAGRRLRAGAPRPVAAPGRPLALDRGQRQARLARRDRHGDDARDAIRAGRRT